MLFNSLVFLVFYVVVTALYFATPYKFRWVILLAASCYFYMAFVPVYILILGFTIVIDYFAAIYIEQASARNKKLLLALSLIANIGILAVFKYFNFINLHLDHLLGAFNYRNPIPYLSILLPLGLSFHTFQAMSYTIEVYRGNQKAERHFGVYSLYVMFYPQLVAGPIERPQNILPQMHKRHFFNYDNMSSGLKLMLWGFFKKIVIADRLALFVDAIFESPGQHNGTTVAIAAFFFAIQIYCDFSGYSDIAIGCAKTMGFDLMTNFKRPYFASNIQEFWRRWHISLTTWFRDYVYFPLGGSHVGLMRMCVNVLIVFLISGIWHGADHSYVLWGLLHGAYLIIYILLKPYLPSTSKNKIIAALTQLLGMLITTSLVTIAWIFFRATSVDDALTLMRSLKSFGATPVEVENHCLLAILILFLVEFKLEYLPQKFNLFNSPNIVVRWGAILATSFTILILGVFKGEQFIYFQF